VGMRNKERVSFTNELVERYDSKCPLKNNIMKCAEKI